MGLFKTENCPICNKKTNAFKKTLAKYNKHCLCRECFYKFYNSKYEVNKLKKYDLDTLRKYALSSSEYNRVIKECPDNEFPKQRETKKKFDLIEESMYLKYYYYDIQVQGVEYRDIDYRKLELEKDLKFELEPDNEFDKNAIKILFNDICIGYIPKNNIQKMIIDYLKYDNRCIRSFISKVNSDENKIEIALGFYVELSDEELNKFECFDVSLIKTSKKIEYNDSTRQEYLEDVSENEEVTIEYQDDTETYLVCDTLGNELGEINIEKSQSILEYEDEGRRFYAVISQLKTAESGKISCKIKVYVLNT